MTAIEKLIKRRTALLAELAEVRTAIAEAKHAERSEPNRTIVESPAMDADLRDLGMSVRLTNCLRNEGCQTLRDAAAIPEARLMKIPNFGKHSVDELYQWLTGNGVPEPIKPLNERHLQGLAMRQEGKTFRQISDDFGISWERTRAIVFEAERRIIAAERRKAALG